MNDEIKEILEYLKSDNWEVGNGDYEKSLYKGDLKILLDYITNLQQELEEEKRIEEADLHKIQSLEEENERLKENNQNMQEEMARVWEENERLKQTQYVWSYDLDMQLEDYKSRCEKAVEYINQFDTDKNFTFPLMPKWEEKQVKASIKLEFKDTYKRPLLNILQNGSENQ